MTVDALIRDRLTAVLEDGSYEALVVDVEAGVLALTIVAGMHKGAVVEVRAISLHDDGLDMLAMPCVLVVQEGQPRVVFD
jgi:hypothetical protein